MTNVNICVILSHMKTVTEYRQDVKKLKALADENRLAIMELLMGGEKCACVLLEKLNITQPTLSHHMKVLSECGLVQVRKSAKWSYYSLNCEQWIAFRDSIDAFRCACVRNDEGRCCWP